MFQLACKRREQGEPREESFVTVSVLGHEEAFLLQDKAFS